MGLPLVSWNPGGGTTSILFKRGPVGFLPTWKGIVHDNVATSGAARERVTERNEILIPFVLPAIVVNDDMAGWGTFMQWAQPGNVFKFYPNSGLTDFYNCVDEATDWEPKRTALGVYGFSFVFRVLQDAQAPADPSVILRRFMGVTP